MKSDKARVVPEHKREWRFVSDTNCDVPFDDFLIFKQDCHR